MIEDLRFTFVSRPLYEVQILVDEMHRDKLE